MSALDCVIADCGNHTQKGTCNCNWLCAYGRFANILDECVAPLANYKIRQYADGTAVNCQTSICGERPRCCYEEPDNSPEAVERRLAFLEGGAG